MAAEILADANLLDPVAQGLLDEVQHFLGILLGLLRLLLFLVGLQAGILGGQVAEFLLLELHQSLGNKLVHILGEEQDIIALLPDQLRLGQLGQTAAALTGGKVEILLLLRHGVGVFLQRHQLVLLAGPEQQQLLQQVLVHAVILADAVFQLAAKGGEEFLVLLPVVGQHFDQLGLDLLFQVGGNDLQLAVMLQHLAGDVQAQILGVHNALDKAEMLGQQVGAVFHNQHAGGIQLQALLVLLGVVVVGRAAGDEQHGLVGHGALHAEVDGGQGILKIEELILVELVVFLVGDVLLAPLPQGHHGVEGLGLHHGLIFGLGGLLPLLGFGLLLQLLGFHIHFDGIADIIGILLHQIAQLVALEILGVVLVVGVGLELQNHIRSGSLPLAGHHGIAVGAGGLPHPGLVAAVLSRHHRDVLRHHKGGIEAHAELADDVHIGVLLQLLLEGQGAALGDGTQVLLHFVPGHADAVVGDGQQAVLLVRFQGNGKVAAVQTHVLVGQRLIGQLVNGVGGVGDDLPQEDLLVGVDGVDHQIKQPFALRLKFLFY